MTHWAHYQPALGRRADGATPGVDSAIADLVWGEQAATTASLDTGALGERGANPVLVPKTVTPTLGFVLTGKTFVFFTKSNVSYVAFFPISSFILPPYSRCHFSSYANNQVFNVPMGGKIPDMDHALTSEGEAVWSKELAVSAMHYTGE